MTRRELTLKLKAWGFKQTWGFKQSFSGAKQPPFMHLSTDTAMLFVELPSAFTLWWRRCWRSRKPVMLWTIHYGSIMNRPVPPPQKWMTLEELEVLIVTYRLTGEL